MRFFLLILLGILVPVWGQAHGLRLRQELGQGQSTRVWVSWQHGWHDSLNHDAVWLFAKELGTQPGGRALAPKAAWLREGADRFTARISTDGVGLWLYPSEGYSFTADSALIELTYPEAAAITVYGLEMVLIPTGGFWIGDSLSNKTLGNQRGGPFYIAADRALPLNEWGGLYTPPLPASAGLLPEAFPVGYKAFFCQKYEISQGAWAGFVQALGLEAQALLYPELAAGSLPLELMYRRSGLRLQDGQLAVSQGMHRAMGGLRWTDLLAYLDWAGLRPMTETEFEKACRGPEKPLAKGYAWNTVLAQTPDSILEDGSVAERPARTVVAGAGWANFARPVGQPYPAGPVRQGFAANSTSNRVGGGFGYWGCAELSGNVWEMCVQVQSGSVMDSTAGDGSLTPEGKGNQQAWLQVAPIVRGGAHTSLLFNDLNYPFRDLAVSDRFYQDYDCSQRRSTTGGRGVRSW